MAKMKGEERRIKIYELLSSSSEHISGKVLAEKFEVSRQVIVNDIALIRTKHPELIATNSGYILSKNDSKRRIFKVKHDDKSTEDELNMIVDYGGIVRDVFVEHKIYGTIRVPLDIASRRDVSNFMKDLNSGISTPLKNITHGYHFHTIEARSEQILDEIENNLEVMGFLIESMKWQNVWIPKSYEAE